MSQENAEGPLIPCCEKCMFFASTQPGAGICRKRPPIPHLLVQKDSLPQGVVIPGGGGVAQAMQVVALWPPVQTGEVCGEWSPNPQVLQRIQAMQAGASSGLSAVPEV